MLRQRRGEPFIGCSLGQRGAHRVQVGAHAFGIDSQIRQGAGQSARTAMHRHHQQQPFGQLGLPGAQRALMFLLHCSQQNGHALRGTLRRRDDHHTRDRIVFVRHGGRPTPARLDGFRHFRHFRHSELAYQHQIFGDLAQAAGKQAQFTAQPPIRHKGMPTRQRPANAKVAPRIRSRSVTALSGSTGTPVAAPQATPMKVLPERFRTSCRSMRR